MKIQDLNLNTRAGAKEFNEINQALQEKILFTKKIITSEDKQNLIVFLQDSQEFQQYRINNLLTR